MSNNDVFNNRSHTPKEVRKKEINEDMQRTHITDTLSAGEEVIWSGKPQKKAFILEAVFSPLFFIALVWGAIDGFFIAMMLGGFGMDTGMPEEMLFFIIPFFALHLMPVWLYIGGIIRRMAIWKNTEYAVTDRRIIFRQGVMGIDFHSVLYTDISNVSVKVSFSDKFLKVGDIILMTKNGVFRLDDLETPYKLYKFIQKVVNDIKTDTLYPNAKRPANNPGYMTKYRPTGEDSLDKK